MPIKIACACGKKLAVKDELAGKKVKCPACQKLLSIPKPKAAEDDWDVEDSAEEDFENERSDAPVKSRGGKSSPSRGAVSRKSSAKGKGKKSKPSNRGLLIGAAVGGGVLVVALLAWMLWPAAPAVNVADNPPANQEQTPAPASSDTVKPINSFPQVVGAQQPLTLKGNFTCVAFSPDGKWMAAGSHDPNYEATVKVWDTTSGQELHTLKGHVKDANHLGTVYRVAFSSDGKRLASASDDQTVKVWDVASGQETLTLKGHTESVKNVAFSPDGNRLASQSYDDTVKVWDATSGKESLTLKGYPKATNEVAFSPDWKRLALAHIDPVVRIWDATSGKVTHALKGHAQGIAGVAFSPDGKRLASASFDGTAKLWDATSGQELLTLTGHTGVVLRVVFSVDGKRLATAGEDKSIRVWDAVSGNKLLTLEGHSRIIRHIAISPDGNRLASCSDDKTLKVWDISNRASETGTAPSVPANTLASDAGNDLKALQGVWQLVEVETGAATPPSATQLDQFKATSITIAGDTMTVAEPSGKAVSSIKLDSTQKPKTIDLTVIEGPNKGAMPLGIYSLDGDTLRMCLARPGALQRPAELKPDPSLAQRVMVLKRADAANAQPAEDKFDHKAWERVQPTLAQIELQGQLISRSQSPDMVPEGLLTVAEIRLPSLRTGDTYPENIISTLKSLTHVFLAAQEMGDARLKQLSELPGLIGLALVGNGRFTITANGLSHLKRSPQLRSLTLNRVSLTPDLMKVIGEISNLRNLTIIGIPATDDLVSNLLPLKELDYLNVSATQLTDAGVAQLAKFSNLELLDLSDTKVTDQGLPSLKGLSKLRRLGLRKLNISPQAVDELQKALPACKIFK